MVANRTPAGPYRNAAIRPLPSTPVDPDSDPVGRPYRPVVVEAITRLNIGGPGRHVLDVAHGLREDFDMRVAAGTAPRMEGELDSSHVSVERLPLVRSVDPRQDTAALVQVRDLLRRHRAGLVHSHMAKAGFTARLAAATLRDRPRTIHTFHGHVLSGYFSSGTERAFARIERSLARRTDVLVAVSAEVRDALLDIGIGTAAQYEVLPLGVDLDPFLQVTHPSGTLRAALRVPSEAPLLGVPARLAPVKDHKMLLRAMVDVPGVHLAVLGDGELRGLLELEATTLGIRDRVHFPGWWEDMPTAFADLDLVVLTSRNEGTPMALIEASGSGRAIVATDVGGVRDVVVDGRTGVLAAAGDHHAVAMSIRDLLADPGRRQALGSAGREHVRNRYGLAASLEAMSSLYRDVLQTPRRTR